MSAISRIGAALQYDAAESMLASGASFASVLAFAAAAAEQRGPDAAEDAMPVSHRPTMPALTVAPSTRR